MEPRIQYAKTSDGVNIAYCATGEGRALVHLPWFPISHLQMEWQVPEIHQWYQRLAEGRMLVRFDCRGGGLSDREVTDFSLDARLLDLEAVVERLGLDRLALFAPLHSGPVAMAYAARHPERVSQLILWCTYALGSDWAQSPQVAGIVAILDKDWHTFTEAAARALAMGWEEGELAPRLSVLVRESVTQQAFQAFVPVRDAVDLTDLLPQIIAPTLVLHRRQFRAISVEVASGLAARIPDSRLALLEGTALMPFAGDMEAALQAINEFLGEGETESPADITRPRPADLPSGTAVILFADIADSTALTERLGDAAFRAKARELADALRKAIRECGGTPVEGPTLGDGVLAAFTSAREAIEAAVRCRDEGSHAGLPLHVGLHAGDVMREKDPDGRANVYGGAVNIAARIAGASAAGEVLVSDIVRGLARTSAGVTFEDCGERELKGIGEPVRVWAVSQRMENG